MHRKECARMALGVHRNTQEWPSESARMHRKESTGMALGISQNSQEWPSESARIHRNDRFLLFQQIPWNSNIPVGVCQNLLEPLEEGKVLKLLDLHISISSHSRGRALIVDYKMG